MSYVNPFHCLLEPYKGPYCLLIISPERCMKLINRTGNFTPGETITGAESGTVQDSVTVDNLTLENVQYADNKYIETTANDLLDFTEVNPFGEYGNVTGEF